MKMLLVLTLFCVFRSAFSCGNTTNTTTNMPTTTTTKPISTTTTTKPTTTTTPTTTTKPTTTTTKPTTTTTKPTTTTTKPSTTTTKPITTTTKPTSMPTFNPYCNISANHTMCRFNASGGPACNGSLREVRLTQADKEAILKWHNDIRENTAYGRENNTIGQMPSGGNMMRCEWHDELAMIAQRHANQCEIIHEPYYDWRQVLNSTFIVGQNIAMMIWGSNAGPFDFVAIIKAFYDDEVSFFNSSDVSVFKFKYTYGHYSQVVWGNTRYIGAGGAEWKVGANTFQMVTVNYGPAGNLGNSPMYLIGAPCSSCPSGTSCNPSVTSLCG